MFIELTKIYGLCACLAMSLSSAPETDSMNIYIGTYTKKTDSKGIYLFKMDLKTGRLDEGVLAAETANPSFLAVHPNRKYLYAAGELGGKTGIVSAFAIEKADGKLTLLNEQSSGGAGPCHLSVDKEGKNVLVANYAGGSIAVLPIGPDGKLAKASCNILHKDPEPGAKPRASHCHSINLDASGKFAFVADLGLDRVFFYRFDGAQGVLVPNEPAALVLAEKAGPRHFAWHSSGRFAYVINELNSTMTAVSFDAEKGSLRELQTLSTLPEGFTGTSYCAEVQAHPSGKFLYGSNRGHDSITIFEIDTKTGLLKLLGFEPTQGSFPRNFSIDPAGQYLIIANQKGNNIVVFRIDTLTGLLKPTGQKIDLPTPVCIKFIYAK